MIQLKKRRMPRLALKLMKMPLMELMTRSNKSQKSWCLAREY
jgi:hypothetical protein